MLIPQPPETNQLFAPARLRQIFDALTAIAHEQQDVREWSDAMSHRGKKWGRTPEKDCVELILMRLEVSCKVARKQYPSWNRGMFSDGNQARIRRFDAIIQECPFFWSWRMKEANEFIAMACQGVQKAALEAGHHNSLKSLLCRDVIVKS